MPQIKRIKMILHNAEKIICVNLCNLWQKKKYSEAKDWF
ncbi:hypothetical protein NU08_0392 [Flavobacterium anhuiense]|uniref:Uncharacterized protein n=1 Tax=Flavobacterium anhuiense TaxID=459526 RepID=A0A444W504_9FLAO|nr:hypothetical protein NU08_0392 [Flavobacterium anhuiense]